MFRKLDADCDGRLSKQEIKLGYQQHYGRQISDKEVEELFEAVDTDFTGYIDYAEFLTAASNQKQYN